MSPNEAPLFYPPSRAAWRSWLENNHRTEQSVWLIYYRKSSDKPSISWSEAVDEALCFGWIDSKHVKIDHESSKQFFTRRKPNSNWSKINKLKVEQLIESGLMTEMGLASIEIAKENGSWTILDEVEELIIPPDLEAAFASTPDSKEFYLSLSKSNQKSILGWIVLARLPETRDKRIKEVVERAAIGKKPAHM